MKFAIINDMHIGPKGSGFAKGVQRKLTEESERLVKRFVNDMNETEHPKFVICLGDLIEDINDREKDIESFKYALDLLAPLKAPLHCLVGNHDVRTLKQEEIADMLGYDRMYYSFDSGDFHFVCLSFEMTGAHTTDVIDIRAEVPTDQVEWLKKDLAKADKTTIVFTHYGLADDNMEGNFWFNGEIKHAALGNRGEVRKILEESGRIKAVINAHQHWNRLNEHNGIPYFTITSLVENTNNDGVPAEAFTIVNLTSDSIDVDVRGNDPSHQKVEFKL
jgi:3',5'-cyclic AMP phosphodiesterase CpdA